VFVTSAVYPASFGGLAAADAICTDRAAAAGLSGPFVAWLSTSTVNAADRMSIPGTSTPARGWVRPDGKPVADRLVDLLAQKIYYPIRLDERGVDHVSVGPFQVFTGTTATGARDTTTRCADWTSITGMFSEGQLARTGPNWTAIDVTTCDTMAHIYCFGVGSAEPLTISSATGRLAFVSLAIFDPSSHAAQADAICATEAQTYNQPGTFLAYLSTTTRTAASRFSPAPAAWVRADGIPLAASGAATLAFDLEAPLGVDVLEHDRELLCAAAWRRERRAGVRTDLSVSEHAVP
jgi:hypothetical protein